MGAGCVRVTGKGGVQGSRQIGQKARGQVLQRPGQEMKRNKEEDIGLESEEGLGTTQEVRAFLSLGTTHLAHQEGQVDSNTHISD